eukprot:TRINITY_DN6685_c0_g1_i2.p1 TRINITY_DN6685_c0_g1~~TRINITY_DN6685_c0_g1_i2.p1  ORF type:complete len:115 (-),score=29.70 TRINITY_DN6685_c0_g1_i2:622-966(-)
MEEQLVAINKENERLKKQMEVLREKLADSKKVLTDTQNNLNEQIDSLSKEVDKERQKMKSLEKKQEELKSRMPVPSTQETTNSEKQMYAFINPVVGWRNKLSNSRKPMLRSKRN